MSHHSAPGSDAGARWARFTTRRRAPILWSALLVAGVAAPIAARLPLLGDLSHLLPPQTASVRDLHALEGRAQVFGTIIIGIESSDVGQRLAAARLVRDRMGALPADTVIDVKYDSAATDRFAWANRHLLVPTADLVALRDELALRKARLNPLYVSLDDEAVRDANANWGPPPQVEAEARRGADSRGDADTDCVKGWTASTRHRADALSRGRGLAQRAAPGVGGAGRGRCPPAGR